MQLLAYLRAEVRANRLANRRLHAALAALPQEAYEAKRTSFFPSLAATLEHILAVDLYYLAALHGEADMEQQGRSAPKAVPLDVLAAAQAAADERFIAHVESLDSRALDEIVTMQRGGGRVQLDRRGHVVAHLVNHQVHHRGQVHAMLAGTAAAPPQLDEFLLPSEAHLRAADLAALGWSEPMLFGLHDAGSAP